MSVEYLTVPEVATVLKMSQEWVRRQCHAGAIPATKVGRAWRIEAGEVDIFVRKYRGSATPPSRPGTARRRRRRVA